MESIGGFAGYVTIREACKLLGKQPWQIRYFVRRNRVLTVRVGRVLLLRARDLEPLRAA